MNHGPAPTTGLLHVIPLFVVSLLLMTYLVALAARRPNLPNWPRTRTAFFVTGCALLVLAFSSPTVSWATADFRGHMAQHLLIGMAAPLALVLGAPITLLLGSTKPRFGRTLTSLLRTPLLRFMTRGWFALLTATGPMVALYFTPLYDLAMASVWAHALISLHFFAAGYLFAWVIAGPDPAPDRASVKGRIIIIGVAVIIHATAAQMLYAGIGVQVHVPTEQRQGAASLMYFGGDVIEIALALALLAHWRQPQRSGQVLRSVA